MRQSQADHSRFSGYVGGIFAALMFAQPLCAEEVRNPFRSQATLAEPTTVSQQTAEKSAVLRPPLQRDALQQYRLLGVMVSDSKQVALLQTRIGEQYIVHQADLLGVEGGKIEEIDRGSITVLQRSKSLKIRVGSVATAVEGASK
jgi:Tfp pilus assembly protein PilP